MIMAGSSEGARIIKHSSDPLSNTVDKDPEHGFKYNANKARNAVNLMVIIVKHTIEGEKCVGGRWFMLRHDVSASRILLPRAPSEVLPMTVGHVAALGLKYCRLNTILLTSYSCCPQYGNHVAPF